MNIQRRIANLPAKAEDIQKYILVGQAKLQANMAAIRAIKKGKVEVSAAAMAAALSDTQDLAEELLYAEARMGEDLAYNRNQRPIRDSSQKKLSGSESSLPPNIDKKQSHEAQQISKHQDKIAQVVARAREEGEVPVRKHVLREIRLSQPKTETSPLPEGKYNIIYADPPWKYSDKLIDGYGAAEHHYSPMSIEELCALPVSRLTENDAVLFLWVTSPFLMDCAEVIRAWGFTYKASFVWDKVKHNYGHYNSVRHEFLLVCTRGNCLPQCKKLENSVQRIERSREHSEKPNQFRTIIESMYPKGKKIELFARKKVDGWVAWGNQIS